jgi:hypothetical protein
MTTNRNADFDGMVERDRLIRWLFLIGSVLFVTVTCTGFGIATGNVIKFGGSQFLLGGIGFAIGVGVMGKLFPRYWVVVPQTSAFVTTNPFVHGTNPNIPYGPGAHPAFPWELRETSGNITLDILTLDYVEEVPTRSAAITVKGSVQFKFSLPHITQVVGIDVHTVEAGFASQINEWLSARLAQMTPDDAKNSIHALRAEIERNFKETRQTFFLDTYGIQVIAIVIASMEFSAYVQTVRDGMDKAIYIADSVRIIMGYDSEVAFKQDLAAGKITKDEIARARDDLLVLSGNASKGINRIDIPGVEELARMLAAIVGGRGK